MRIVVFSQYWRPENGIPQRRWEWLTRLLIAEGHEVLVVAPPPKQQRDNLSGIFTAGFEMLRVRSEVGACGEVIIRSPYIKSGHSLVHRAAAQGVIAVGQLFAVVKKRKQLFDFKPDLVVGTVPAIPTAYVSAIAARILTAPYAIDLRDAWPDLLSVIDRWNESTGRQSLRERILGKLPAKIIGGIVSRSMNRILTRAGTIFVTSGLYASELEGRLGTSHAKPSIRVVRNVFPPKSEISKTPKPAESSEAPLKILYAGTLGRAQNLQDAITAAEIAEESGIKICLKLIGAGAARKALERRVRNTKVNVEILDRRPAEELTQLYSWCDTALIHLASWPELRFAVPSKTFELMHLGKHVTAVVDGEARELIESLEAGDVATPGDPVGLAKVWVELFNDRSKLVVKDRAHDWVDYEYRKGATKEFLAGIKEAANGEHGRSAALRFRFPRGDGA